jgi:hypothetical protein
MGYRPNEVPNQMTQIQAIDPAPATADDPAEIWVQCLQGTNIDVNTLLATDYLNHFNEVIMLIEMLPDMLEDVLAWERKSYQQHFADSEFKDKNLAVEAYDFAPERVLSQFEALVACLDGHLWKTQNRLRDLDPEVPSEVLADDIATAVEKLHRLVGMISCVVNGSGAEVTAEEVAAPSDTGGNSAQDEIDAMF